MSFGLSPRVDRAGRSSRVTVSTPLASIWPSQPAKLGAIGLGTGGASVCIWLGQSAHPRVNALAVRRCPRIAVFHAAMMQRRRAAKEPNLRPNLGRKHLASAGHLCPFHSVYKGWGISCGSKITKEEYSWCALRKIRVEIPDISKAVVVTVRQGDKDVRAWSTIWYSVASDGTDWHDALKQAQLSCPVARRVEALGLHHFDISFCRRILE